jgi:hypothetical protein
MRFCKTLAVVVGIVVLSFALVPKVNASDFDQKTIVTFNQPVEVPGKVLVPGTYVFKVLDTAGTRDVVQVLDKSETHVIGTFLTIPTEMSKPPERPFIRFSERASGSPEAIEAWFYPGHTDGHEFVYPREHAVELAKANNQNVASMPDNLKTNITQLSTSNTPPSSNNTNESSVVEMKNATVDRVTPEDADVGATLVAITVLTPAVAGSDMQADNSHKRMTASAELPKTASPLPLLALFGALSMVAGLTLLLFAKQLA